MIRRALYRATRRVLYRLERYWRGRILELVDAGRTDRAAKLETEQLHKVQDALGVPRTYIATPHQHDFVNGEDVLIADADEPEHMRLCPREVRCADPRCGAVVVPAARSSSGRPEVHEVDGSVAVL